MTSREKRKTAVLSSIKSFFTKNIAIKVVAALFAMLLWGYVLTDQRPMRTKVVSDVSTSFDGEADLIAQGMCIRGDRSEILTDVSVSVRAQITNYESVSARTVNAIISLRNISEPREYELPITATVSSGLGTVQQVTPSTVTVEIDTMVTQTVPVTTSFTGELAEGYWADMDALSTTTRLDITGARTDVSRVTRAECVVDLTDRSSTIYSTFDVVLYDRDGGVVSSDIVIGTIPTSTVRLPIYPMRNVPIDALGSLVGVDNLASNYELGSAVATPSTVRVVGDEATISGLESLQLEPIAVNGLNASQTVEAEIIVPENVRLLDTDPVSVLIEVREISESKDIENLPITVVGLGAGLSARLDVESVDLTIKGRTSIVSRVTRGEVSINIDVTGLEAGTYTQPLQAFIRDEETTVELTSILSVTTATVTIQKD